MELQGLEGSKKKEEGEKEINVHKRKKKVNENENVHKKMKMRKLNEKMKMYINEKEINLHKCRSMRFLFPDTTQTCFQKVILEMSPSVYSGFEFILILVS